MYFLMKVTDWSPGTELGGGECKIHIELVGEKICQNSKLSLLIYIPHPKIQCNSSFSAQCFGTLKRKIISKGMICKILPILDLNDTVKFHHGQFISSTKTFTFTSPGWMFYSTYSIHRLTFKRKRTTGKEEQMMFTYFSLSCTDHV